MATNKLCLIVASCLWALSEAGYYPSPFGSGSHFGGFQGNLGHAPLHKPLGAALHHGGGGGPVLAHLQEPVIRPVVAPYRAPYVEPYKYAPRPYNYAYGVHDEYTGTKFTANEESDGGNVKGSYSVLLPDGRTQTVTYWADPITGFHADVTYTGTPYYPPPPYNIGHKGPLGALGGGAPLGHVY